MLKLSLVNWSSVAEGVYLQLFFLKKTKLQVTRNTNFFLSYCLIKFLIVCVYDTKKSCFMDWRHWCLVLAVSHLEVFPHFCRHPKTTANCGASISTNWDVWMSGTCICIVLVQIQTARILWEEHGTEAVHRWDREWLLLARRPGTVPRPSQCLTQPWQVSTKPRYMYSDCLVLLVYCFINNINNK